MGKEKICGIYKITNPKRKIYIGRSIDVFKRWNRYKRYDCKKQYLLYRSLVKYGWNEHKFEIICQCDELDTGKLEKYYIELFQCYNSKYGLNLREGGVYFKMSEEIKRKISPLGRHHTETTKKLISKKQKGISKGLGRKFTQEHKDKIGNANRGGKNYKAKKIINIETKKIYDCIPDVLLDYKIKRVTLTWNLKHRLSKYPFMYLSDYIEN